MNKIYGKNKKAGFTLIEMLLVMAIISLVAGAILVTISSQKGRAQQARALAELSGVLQQMYNCWSDGGVVSSPGGTNGSGTICSFSGIPNTNYGTWPKTGADSGMSTFGQYTATITDSNSWYIQISDTVINVCCNGKSLRCAQLSGVCSDSVDLSVYN